MNDSNLYKINYRYSEKRFKDFYVEACSEDSALIKFKEFRPQAREFTIIEVNKNDLGVGRLLALSRHAKRMREVQKELDILKMLPETYERNLAKKHLTKVMTQCSMHINGTHRNLQKLKQHHTKTNS